MATDDAEPPLGDGSHRATPAPQTDTGLTRRDRLRDSAEQIAELGRVERYSIAFVLVCTAGITVGVYQVLSAKSVLLLAAFESVFTVLLLATVIVLTVGASDEADTHMSTGRDDNGSSIESWRHGRRRP